jgi:hypothetical protein
VKLVVEESFHTILMRVQDVYILRQSVLSNRVHGGVLLDSQCSVR